MGGTGFKLCLKTEENGERGQEENTRLQQGGREIAAQALSLWEQSGERESIKTLPKLERQMFCTPARIWYHFVKVKKKKS